MRDQFQDRVDAGQRLAAQLKGFANDPHTVVLGLPRGGVPVAYQVAQALNLPLDIFVVRKMGAPKQPELAIGAMASGGSYHLNEELIRRLEVSPSDIQAVMESESREVLRREEAYRGGRAPLNLKGQSVILVDDGIATGASMLVALQAIRGLGPREILVAVPVIAVSSIPDMERNADGLIYVTAPYEFRAVGQWYSNFDATSDEEVRRLLKNATKYSPTKNFEERL